MWLGASEKVLLVLRERCAYLLRPRVSFILAVLVFLVGSSCDCWRRCLTSGSVFELDMGIIVREREARKLRIKNTGSVVAHNFKIK